MSDFKVHKSVLVRNDWRELYSCLGNDTQRVADFIKLARKTHKVRANDLDTVLNDIGQKVNEYLSLDGSGLTSH